MGGKKWRRVRRARASVLMRSFSRSLALRRGSPQPARALRPGHGAAAGSAGSESARLGPWPTKGSRAGAGGELKESEEEDGEVDSAGAQPQSCGRAGAGGRQRLGARSEAGALAMAAGLCAESPRPGLYAGRGVKPPLPGLPEVSEAAGPGRGPGNGGPFAKVSVLTPQPLNCCLPELGSVRGAIHMPRGLLISLPAPGPAAHAVPSIAGSPGPKGTALSRPPVPCPGGAGGGVAGSGPCIRRGFLVARAGLGLFNGFAAGVGTLGPRGDRPGQEDGRGEDFSRTRAGRRAVLGPAG